MRVQLGAYLLAIDAQTVEGGPTRRPAAVVGAFTFRSVVLDA